MQGSCNNAVIPSRDVKPYANVLCNCVGLANGAFNEAYCALTGKPPKEYFRLTCNGCNFIDRARSIPGLKDCIIPADGTPPVGGIICWGAGLNHVAYIAEVHSKDEITIVQAGFATPVWTETNNAKTGYVCDVRKIYRHDGGFNKWAYSSSARSSSGFVLGYIANPGFLEQPGVPIGPLPYNPNGFFSSAFPPSGVRMGEKVYTPQIYINNKWVKADIMLYDGASWKKCL